MFILEYWMSMKNGSLWQIWKYASHKSTFLLWTKETQCIYIWNRIQTQFIVYTETGQHYPQAKSHQLYNSIIFNNTNPSQALKKIHDMIINHKALSFRGHDNYDATININETLSSDWLSTVLLLHLVLHKLLRYVSQSQTKFLIPVVVFFVS